MRFGTIVIVGGSRGIGAAVAQHLISQTDRLITISRSPSVGGECRAISF